MSCIPEGLQSTAMELSASGRKGARARPRTVEGGIGKKGHPQQARKRKQSETDLNKPRTPKYRGKYLEGRVRQARSRGSKLTIDKAMAVFGIILEKGQTWASEAHRLPETKRAIRTRFKALVKKPVQCTESDSAVQLSQRKPEQQRDPEPTPSSQRTACESQSVAESGDDAGPEPQQARPTPSLSMGTSGGIAIPDATRRLFQDPPVTEHVESTKEHVGKKLKLTQGVHLTEEEMTRAVYVTREEFRKESPAN